MGESKRAAVADAVPDSSGTRHAGPTENPRKTPLFRRRRTEAVMRTSTKAAPRSLTVHIHPLQRLLLEVLIFHAL